MHPPPPPFSALRPVSNNMIYVSELNQVLNEVIWVSLLSLIRWMRLDRLSCKLWRACRRLLSRACPAVAFPASGPSQAYKSEVSLTLAFIKAIKKKKTFHFLVSFMLSHQPGNRKETHLSLCLKASRVAGFLKNVLIVNDPLLKNLGLKKKHC